MTDALFGLIARVFPTRVMDRNPALNAIWRVLFYLFRPRRPFVLRTRHYRLIAHPGRGSLTRAVIRHGCWEPRATAALIARLRPGGFAVDVGANFGHYALTLAQLLGEEGLVIAFEPNPAAFELLAANARLNGYRNLVVEQAALGETNGALALITDTESPGGHSFSAANVSREGEAVTVPVNALDDYLARQGVTRRLDLLKIDVQGFEAKVVRGAAKVLARDRPTVLCEIWPEGMRNAGDDAIALLDDLLSLGYRAKVVAPESPGPVPVTRDEAAALLRDPGCQYCDVLFEPAHDGVL